MQRTHLARLSGLKLAAFMRSLAEVQAAAARSATDFGDDDS
jgi:hypothetical protein